MPPLAFHHELAVWHLLMTRATRGILGMWCSLFVLLVCCASVLAFSLPEASAGDTEHVADGAPYGMSFEEFLAEWDGMEETCGVSFCEWQSMGEMDDGVDDHCAREHHLEKAVGHDETVEQPKERQNVTRSVVHGTKPKLHSEVVAFAKPKSPKDFVRNWLEQKRLFQNLQYCKTPEQRRELQSNYYPYATAGRLLEELGEKEFLEKFGGGSAEQMRKAAAAESRQRKATEGDQEVAEAIKDAGRANPGTMAFAWSKSPKSFVKRWPVQKRLVQDLPRPLSPEHRRLLWYIHYPFVAAGQLFEELGEEAFLNKFGEGTINQMQKATIAEIRQRKMAKDVEDSKKNSAGVVAFTKFKSPEDFVRRWPEQKRLFEGLQRPFSPEQHRVLTKTFYRFTAAGQLLEELGEEGFLQEFGGSSVTHMEKTTTVEIGRRKAAKKDAAKSVPGMDEFVRFKTPQEFIENWPKQKRLFESLPHPFSPEQERALKSTYYRFVAAGQLLEELGREAFLQQFRRSTVNQMQRAAVTEIQQRKAAEKGRKKAEGAPAVVAFARPKSPKDFVGRWSGQKRLFENLSRPLSPEQTRELQCTYYRFTAAGQLLDEIGKKEFLQRYGGGPVKHMQKATAAEVKERKMAGKDKEREKDPYIVGLVAFSSPEDFVERWSEQKRVAESFPHHKTSEQTRALCNAYYRFTAAGQLLEELGKDEFLQRYREGSVNQMRKNAAAEIKQRGMVEKGKGSVVKKSTKTKKKSRAT